MIRNEYRLSYLVVLSLLLGCKNDHRIQVTYSPADKSYSEVYSVVNDSIKDGPYHRYYENGTLKVSCNYKLGVLEGVEKTYDKNGTLKKMETYVNGIAHGKVLLFYPSGNIKLEQEYVNDALHGLSCAYYESGVLKESVNMEKGFENGPFEEYYPTGALHWKGKFKRGPNEQDTLYQYKEDGELLKKLFCQWGWCHTIYENGKTIESVDEL